MPSTLELIAAAEGIAIIYMLIRGSRERRRMSISHRESDFYANMLSEVESLREISEAQSKKIAEDARETGILIGSNEKLDERLKQQRIIIDELQQKVAVLQEQQHTSNYSIQAMLDENAHLRHRLQVEEAKTRFLQDENNALYRQVKQLENAGTPKTLGDTPRL